MGNVEQGVSRFGQPTRLDIDPVGVAQDLVKIPSYRTEADVNSYITSFIRAHGPEGFSSLLLPTGRKGRETLIVANSERPDLIVMGHVDTVEPTGSWTYKPFDGTLHDGSLYGLGAADQKGGIAAMLAVLASFKGREVELPLIMFAFTSQEEGSLKGMESFARYLQGLQKNDSNYKPRFIISTNGSNNEVGWQCRGLVEFVIDIKGTTGHAAIRTPGKQAPLNAHSEGSKAIFSVADSLLSLSKTTLGLTTMNDASGAYGILQESGRILKSKGNQVPDILRTRVEFRPNGGEINGQGIDADVLLRLIEEEAKVRGLSMKMRELVHNKPAWISRREDIEWFENIVEEETGEKPGEWRAEDHGFDEIAGVHDAVSHDLNNPVGAVIWSLADRDEFHMPNEHMELDGIKMTAAVLRQSFLSSELR